MTAIFINTRPAHYPPYLLTGVAEYALPLLDFVPKKIEQNQLDKIKNNHYNALVFVSPMAVDFFVKIFDPKNLSANLPVIAVGQSTKNSLKNNGINAICPPANAENNEGMLALPIIQSLIAQPTASALIVKGVGGRTVFFEHLTANGVQVDKMDLYERIVPNDLNDKFYQFIQTHHQSTPIFVLVSSEQSFCHWQLVLKNYAIDLKDLNAVYLCLGERLTTLVQSFGVTTRLINDLKNQTIQSCIDNFLL